MKQESYAINIDHADYKATNAMEIAQQQTHLTKNHQKDLVVFLQKYQKPFSGKLGKYGGKKIKLEVHPDAIPVHARPYSVPRSQLNVFKRELEHLIEIGVLKFMRATEWASPSFIQQKKGNTVRWLLDFRELNKVLKR